MGVRGGKMNTYETYESPVISVEPSLVWKGGVIVEIESCQSAFIISEKLGIQVGDIATVRPAELVSWRAK